MNRKDFWGRTFVFLLAFLVKKILAESAWFQTCDDKHKYSLSSLDCKLGLWMNMTLDASCVCLNGVWIVSQDLCDSHAMLLVGAGECFALTRPIRSIKLLGRADNPFASASYVADENLDVFVKITEGNYNKRLDSSTSLVISVYQERALRRSDHEVCLHQGSKSSYRAVHIWKNPRRVSSRFKLVNASKCQETVHYDFHVGFGEAFQEFQVLTTDLMRQDCSHKCLTPPAVMNQRQSKSFGRGISQGRNAGFGRALKKASSSSSSNAPAPSNNPNTTKWQGLYTPNQNPDFKSNSSLNEKQTEQKKNWYKFRWNMTLPLLSHSREVREQSVRMIQAQTNFLLLNQPPPKINTPEYDYFQKFRQIFVGIVPNDIINHDVVNGLMRMFRVLLWESHDKFQYLENPNIEQYARIMSKLNECVWNVTGYPFVFTDMIDPTETTVPRAHNVHPCLERTVEVYWNDSFQLEPDKVNFVHTNLNLSDLAEGERENFNISKYDFVIELAWKIYLFGYYRCYEYFEEQATDAHQLAESVQSLFNPRVVKRWYEPEDFNKVLPLIFPNLNLSQFAWAVDKMLVGSRESSEWTTILGRRPIPMTEEDIPQSSDIKDLDKGKPKRSGGREKRYALFWNDQAHCMHSYADPIKKFKYAGKPGCFIAHPS